MKSVLLAEPIYILLNNGLCYMFLNNLFQIPKSDMRFSITLFNVTTLLENMPERVMRSMIVICARNLIIFVTTKALLEILL